MDLKLLLCAWAFLCLGGIAMFPSPGTDFALVIMQNVITSDGKPHLELLLTSFFPDTKANIRLPRRSYSTVVPLTTGIPTPFELPRETELLGSARSNMTIRVISNKPISVVAINMMPYSTGVAAVSPISDLGNEYYIMIPDSTLDIDHSQVAIVNGPKSNLVSVLLKGLVQLDDTTYLPGEQLNLTLAPWESVQLQTNESLTSSHLVSQEPVAVFAGHACAGLTDLCNHVYIQIPPTIDWGSTFVLPPIESLGRLTIMSARNTLVNLLHGNDTTELTVSPGMMQSFDVDPSIPLVIQSQERIMVFVNFGKINKSGVLSLSPLEKACVAYAIISLKDYNNSVLLVVSVHAREGLELDHKPILGLEWDNINTTQLVFANLPLSGESYHLMLDAGHDFGLVTIGTGKLGSYVLPGICLNKEYLLCGFECKNDICNAPGDTAACLSLEPPTCMAWGNMQLLTFYGAHMIGSGFCPQTLIYSKGDDLSLLLFSVERVPGSDLALLINVFGQLLAISTKQPGVVYVNDEKLHTPISLYNGNLTIGRFGLLATTVNASFGLRVIIGDRGFLHLQIARRYYPHVSGDCIAQSSMEMLASTGSRILPTQLICEPLTEVHLQGCDNTLAAGSSCQIMSESEIFQSCHLSLDPKPFIVNCQGEVCTGGSPCASIELYALACGINGFHLTGWRNISNCDLQCPVNSHYESCPSSCQASCSETQVFNCDTSLCYDACLCDEGYELSGGSCVPKEECGCYWQGGYYPKEESFGNNCSRKCQCLGSNMTCYLTEGCNVGYNCEQNSGLWSCKPWHAMSCTMHGDSHYTLFNGQAYNFKGLCDSKMVSVCSNDTDLTAFEVHVIQKPIEDVSVTVYGKTIALSPNYEGKVNVDGTLVHTPYIVGTSLQIYRSNLDVLILQTDFGLAVSFDWMKRLLIMVPHSYMGSLCGLCASEVNAVSNKASCEQTCQGICTNCSSEIYLKATTTCGLMTDPLGAFRLCNQKVDPQAYFEACINDLCSGLAHCSAFYAYAAACWEASAEVGPWAYSIDCGYECPPNSTYTSSQHCISSCLSTCEIVLPFTCALQCQEGCQCNPGYMLNGDRCVLHEDCGCYLDGRYWKRGDLFYDDQCQKQCACLEHGIECKDHNCTSEEQCANIKGVWACYSSSSTCSVSGQSYHTFDGLVYPVNKNCLYVMAIVIGTERVNFEVHLRRKMSSDLASVQEVILKVYGYMIVLNLHSEGIEVNGNLTNLPIDLDNQIFGYENVTNIVLETDFGLHLTFNPSTVSLTIPLSYAGLVRGLCGNANAVAGDDYDNLPIDKFVASWRSYADNSACDETSNKTPSDILEFDAKKYCELIPEVEGPFQECHVVINPQGFYNNCMSTMNGDLESVCESIEYYNRVCQRAGVTVRQWESETICEPERPPVDKTSTSAPSMPQAATEIQCLHNMIPTTCQSLGKSTCLFQSSRGMTLLGGDINTTIKCNLSLAKVCHNDAELDSFSVSVHYDIIGGQRTDRLHIEVYGLNIALPWNWENGVLVNNMPVGPSTCLIPGRLQISHEGPELVLAALNGLVIKYNHKGLVHIYIPSGYQNYICGQCAEKDSHENSVKLTSEVSNYSDNQCLIGVTKEPWANAKDDSTSYCSLLLDKSGPFGKCHRILNPDRFYDLCLFHMCQELQRGGNGDSAACHGIGEYVMLCQLHRIVIKPWRNESFCPFKCPSPATYELCTKTCIQCQNGKCTNHCLEGCNCGDGYYWNGVNCVGSDVCPKNTSAEPNNLNCDTDLSSPTTCHVCRLNDQQISTFGNISSPLEGNGVYDILRKCDSSAPQWLRVTLQLQPPNPVKLFIFYERNFITINSAVEVWVNSQLQELPVTLEQELSISKSANTVVFSLPGSMTLSFSSARKLEIEVTESLSTELCGACAFGNLFPSHSPLFSLESWRAEDLS